MTDAEADKARIQVLLHIVRVHPFLVKINITEHTENKTDNDQNSVLPDVRIFHDSANRGQNEKDAGCIL